LSTEKDLDLLSLAREELLLEEKNKDSLEEIIKYLLIPRDPEDAKNIVLEIRAGTGGDEASIFAGDLFRMYCRFFDKKGWKYEVLDHTDGTMGGYKEIVTEVSGENVFETMKFESGVHRVQRVPQTETQGRVHTSAAGVIVMPEADEWDIEVKDNDIRKDIFCASGPGGQSVNTTKSAIRLTHIPSGLVVQCQDEKSQHKNLEKAMSVLRSRLYELEYQKRLTEASKKRKTMVATGDRSEKIRTYNYPQSRVTDHRIGYTIYNLPAFMDGDIGDLVDGLRVAENAEKLKEGTSV
jgi:peptide chain release factor 1